MSRGYHEDQIYSKREFPDGSEINAALSLLRTLVWSLVRKLRFYKPRGAAKKKQNTFFFTQSIFLAEAQGTGKVCD